VNCNWASGETRAHLNAKQVLADGLRQLGWPAEIEFTFETLTGDRRADVAICNAQNDYIAFELQHTSISLDEIERRAFSYSNANIIQLWIAFLKPSIWNKALFRGGNEWFIEKYVAPPFERWIHGLHMGDGMWMYDQRDGTFWHVKQSTHMIDVPYSSWYTQGGEEQSAGGFSKPSKKWKNLTLNGPYRITELNVFVKRRSAKTLSIYNWPAGRVARFQPR
jgi:competence protein CoiA